MGEHCLLATRLILLVVEVPPRDPLRVAFVALAASVVAQILIAAVNPDDGHSRGAMAAIGGDFGRVFWACAGDP